MGPILEATPLVLELAADIENLGPLNPVLRHRPTAYMPGQAPDPDKILEDAGVMEAPMRVKDRWVAVLAPLCTTSLEYIADFVTDEGKFTGIAATGPGGSTLALRQRVPEERIDTVKLREARDREVLPSLLDLLALEPGRGSMQSMYIKEAKEAAASVHEPQLSPAHKELATLLARPQVGPAVEITVGVRDANRMYSYTKFPLHIGHFDWGHYITYSIGDGDDQQFFGGPATYDNITTALDTLRSTLSR